MHLLSDRLRRKSARPVFLLATLAISALAAAEQTARAVTDTNAGFAIVADESLKLDEDTQAQFVVRVEAPSNRLFSALPFNQSAVKQEAEAAFLGQPDRPFFKLRFALPIPPDNDTNLTGALVGVDPYVWAHNHSPGLQVLPNGDVLAVYFSAKSSSGASERLPSARFVQARLRHGAEEWDLPELFFDSRDFNDQSALLWTDGNTVRFFGGGRENPVLFKMMTSIDNGATWTFSLPKLDKPAADFTAQPIANAFRDSSGGMYFAMDAEENSSFLWRSMDGGKIWHDMGGRTGGRHSTIVPLSDGRTLLSLGGKNSAVNGFTPQNRSDDWGATWSESAASAFPALGGNQRPSLIRLANGNLCFVTDSYHRRKDGPPEGWAYGEGAFIAISKDDGATWRIKRLPVELPHEADKARGTLGYATVAQAPNGMIHVLATMTHPCLHYELNEAWIYSDAGEVDFGTKSARVKKFTEKFSNGKMRIAWSAKIFSDGRYALHGEETSYYDNGKKEHEARYVNGRKSGVETFWARDGKKVWTWERRLDKDTGTWTHYWPNGKRRIVSNWNLNPRARDRERTFSGLAANGLTQHWTSDGHPAETFHFVDGVLVSERAIRETAESRLR